MDNETTAAILNGTFTSAFGHIAPYNFFYGRKENIDY